MKIPNKIVLLLIYIIYPVLIFSNSVEINGNKLEINENNSRFTFSTKVDSSGYISMFSGENPRTSSISVYENNAFYTLGDSRRFHKNFKEKADGGIFTWTSNNLLIKQEYTLQYNGSLQIDISLSNISTTTIRGGLKFLLDTGFEEEDFFYVRLGSENLEVNSEFEVGDPADVQFWTSGIKNSSGAALMGITFDSAPSRIIFGNWSLLDKADYLYKTNPNRVFNNLPYSINDAAVLYLYSPTDILPQKSLKYSIVLRSVKTVEHYNHIGFENNKTEIIPEEIVPEIQIISAAEEELDNEGKNTSEPVDEAVALEDPSDKIEEPISESDKIELTVDSEEKSSDLVNKQLNILNEIQNLIETFSKPGIIIEYNLLKLEELINKLEEPGINENK